jgi:hypothetical protein
MSPLLEQNTPGTLTPALEAVLRQVSPQPPLFVEVTPVGDSAPMHCYGNVERLVSGRGGEAVSGWIVYEGGSGRYLKLVHHHLWRTPDGTLVDPTPSDERRNLFLPDPTPDREQAAHYIQMDDSAETAAGIEFMKRLDGDHLRMMGMFKAAISDAQRTPARRPAPIRRNSPCPCSSGRKFKRCCGRNS